MPVRKRPLFKFTPVERSAYEVLAFETLLGVVWLDRSTWRAYDPDGRPLPLVARSRSELAETLWMALPASRRRELSRPRTAVPLDWMG